ncbi:MAG TPA: biotin/lipoyl-containing protein, partial [Candidatus Limnocylindrales bacterium]
YGFLAENAHFAEVCASCKIKFIGPKPSAITAMGDKAQARKTMMAAKVPVVPGSKDVIKEEKEALKLAHDMGYPVIIKAVAGGGGKGMRVVHNDPALVQGFHAARREAEMSFGNGDVYIEKYIENPRHVEIQILADEHGNVIHLNERDCSLQRRHQKLVEEAPAPFLSRQQNAEMVRASKAILKEAGYRGAGTCEFLVGQDGVISFLEVNARLQVEHPVTEEVTGIDLVREQFRIASGEAIGYSDPPPTRHSIEFRINGEDAGRNFMPAPGVVVEFSPPSGPGVRLDSGVESGDVIGGAFDSMLAKLIITGKDRTQALARARRALAEFVIDGMPTVLPFHRAVVSDEAFAPKNPAQPFLVHTRWIETEFVNEIPAYAGVVALAPEDTGERQSVVVEVGGKRLEVVLPGGLSFGGAGSATKKKAPKRSRGTKAGAVTSGDSLTAPMQGTIVKIAVENGQMVEAGDLVVVLEAMKMEQPINAHKAGTITNLSASVGETVTNGAVVAEIKD